MIGHIKAHFIWENHHLGLISDLERVYPELSKVEISEKLLKIRKDILAEIHTKMSELETKTFENALSQIGGLEKKERIGVLKNLESLTIELEEETLLFNYALDYHSKVKNQSLTK